jgi:hypothetical protein
MRQTTVAGQFYPLSPRILKKELARHFSDLEVSSRNVIGAVVPHAGYVYSGSVAAHAYAVLPEADTFILFGPNHTGFGSVVAVSQETWATPLGEIETDVELARSLAGTIVNYDETAHRYEHSIEVQLPFLQYRFKGGFKILPICLGLQDEETAVEVGNEIARAVKECGRKVVIIASSDLTHYQPVNIAQDIDHYLIEAILDMDVPELYRRIAERSASACGYGPISAMITAAVALGANKATLLKYATSADVTGDTSSVVGYSAIVLE